MIEADLVVLASLVDHPPLEVDVRPPKGDDGAKAMARLTGEHQGKVKQWTDLATDPQHGLVLLIREQRSARLGVLGARHALAGLLERSEASGEGYRFTVKGGVALELRLRDRARATKDIDLVLHHADADLARAFERAVTTGGAGHQGFQFRRKGEPLNLENRTISVEFAVTYEGGAWTSNVVDVARAEPGEGDVELVPAIPLREATGISGPTELACLPRNPPFSVCHQVSTMTALPLPTTS